MDGEIVNKTGDQLQEFYHDVVESSNMGIWVLDNDLKTIFVNRKLKEMLDYSREELNGVSILVFIKEADRGSVINTIDACRGRISCEPQDIKFIRSDGAEICAIMGISPVFDSNGKILTFVCFLWDITERKRREAATIEQLEESNLELAALTRVTDSAIKTLNIHELVNSLLDRLVDIVRADAGMLLLKEDNKLRITSSIGIKAPESSDYSLPVGQSFAQIIIGIDRPLYIEDVQEDPRTPGTFLKEQGIRTMLGVPLKYEDRLIGVLYLQWYTIHKENKREVRLLEVTADRCAMAINNALLYERVRKARDELGKTVEERTLELSDTVRDLRLEAEVRKMTQKSLRDMKDEIEQYLGLIGRETGRLSQSTVESFEMVMNSPHLNQEEKRRLLMPLYQLWSYTRLVKNITTMEWVKAGGLRTIPIDICHVIEGLKTLYTFIPGRQVIIYFEPIHLCHIRANELVEGVFANLIDYAIGRSVGDKPIAIDIRPKRTTFEGKSYIEVEVADDGPGIPDERKEDIFDRFHEGTASSEGLELFTVKKLVESYNGRIRLEDRVPGDYTKGARFVVLFPATL